MFNAIIGVLSLIVGVISLYYSRRGYREANGAKKLVEKFNWTKETRDSYREKLREAEARGQADKKIEASELLALLIRIRENDSLWNTNSVNEAINNLQKAIKNLQDEASWDIANNTSAISVANGVIEAYIDFLGK